MAVNTLVDLINWLGKLQVYRVMGLTAGQIAFVRMDGTSICPVVRPMMLYIGASLI